MYRFSNNAVGALAAALDAEALTLELGVGEGALFNTLQPYDTQDGSVQLVTLTNSTTPGIYEIAALEQGDGTDAFTVRRGLEGTVDRAWPPGTQVSARITAGMLGRMLQVSEDPYGIDDSVKTTGSRININGRISSDGPCAQISGWSTLQIARVSPGRVADSNFTDLNMSHESMGASRILSAGTTATWTPSSYTEGSVVKPTVPNGYQFLLESDGGTFYDDSATEPAFTPDPEYDVETVEVLDAGGAVVGYWTPMAEPINFSDRVSQAGLLMVTEVGFICLEYDGATTPPTVSIGTLANPTLYASAVSLTKITDSNTCHRIVIPEGGDLQSYIKFRVDTPSDGKCIGRFYWRGQSIQPLL